MSEFHLVLGDCLEKMRTMPSNSVDSIVTDPPYGLGFMGKKWDVGVPAVDVFAECFRVLKPGGHLLAFGGSRTYHRLAVAVEDAGFEIRDQIMWIYGSGFPKSQNVSKAIDKAAGAKRERILGPKTGGMASLNKGNAAHGYRDSAYYDDGNMMLSNKPATDAARQWDGWGTALKPAHEPIVVARKPLAKGNTVAANVLAHGTGALNIDGCRVGTESLPAQTAGQAKIGTFERRDMTTPARTGRWPANLIHDGSDEVLSGFQGVQKGLQKGAESPARFFYQAKASRKDRGEGNKHPTVKPCDLMRYLVRLVTPPGGTVLDPFMGSGSTGKAAVLEGFDFIGIELDEDSVDVARWRIGEAARQ